MTGLGISSPEIILVHEDVVRDVWLCFGEKKFTVLFSYHSLEILPRLHTLCLRLAFTLKQNSSYQVHLSVLTFI